MGLGRLGDEVATCQFARNGDEAFGTWADVDRVPAERVGGTPEGEAFVVF